MRGQHSHGYSQEALEWSDSPDYTQDDGDNLSQPVDDIQELVLQPDAEQNSDDLKLSEWK